MSVKDLKLKGKTVLDGTVCAFPTLKRLKTIGGFFARKWSAINFDSMAVIYSLLNMIFFQSNTSNAGGKGKKKKEIDPTLLKARVMRETRNIPNLIAKLETFMGNLQKLASKGGLISENFSHCTVLLNGKRIGRHFGISAY